MIEIRDIAVQTKGFSLRDVSLTVHSNSCHVIIGPTGCGKTTLLEAVIGFRKMQKGRIILDGTDITDLPVHERSFSYVPQDLAIFPHLTVQDNIFYGIRHSGIANKKERYEAALELVNSLSITHLIRRRSVNLSGGERQRVALARALAPGHRYLLLDEPLSALHEGMKKELWFLLKSLQKKYGFTILMVSHDMEETFFLADHISVMIDGKIHQSGIKEDVYNMPSTGEVADFFGINNLFKAAITETHGDFSSIYCPELSAALVVPSGRLTAFKHEAAVKAGIRPEEIMILRADRDSRERENILHGKIEGIFEKGASYLIIFKPERAERTIEIELPNYAFRKLGIEKGRSVVIALKAENIFLVAG
jgi:ABC-type Fe3+/spermidine/putrescine transport system ATPase subunit